MANIITAEGVKGLTQNKTINQYGIILSSHANNPELTVVSGQTLIKPEYFILPYTYIIKDGVQVLGGSFKHIGGKYAWDAENVGTQVAVSWNIGYDVVTTNNYLYFRNDNNASKVPHGYKTTSKIDFSEGKTLEIEYHTNNSVAAQLSPEYRFTLIDKLESEEIGEGIPQPDANENYYWQDSFWNVNPRYKGSYPQNSDITVTLDLTGVGERFFFVGGTAWGGDYHLDVYIKNVRIVYK